MTGIEKKLVNITSNFPYPKFSFSGVFLASQMKYLNASGWEISTIHPFALFSRGRFGTPKYESTDYCDVYRPSYGWSGGQFHRILPFEEWWAFERSVRSCIKRNILSHSTPGLIMGNWLYPTGPGSVNIAKDLGIPVVLIARGGDVEILSNMPERLRCVVLEMLEEADLIIANNNTLLDEIGKLVPGIHKRKLIAMDFGVDTEIFTPVSLADRLIYRTNFQLDALNKSILYVGRWEKEKGCLDFLHIIPKVMKLVNGWDFVVAGPILDKRSAKRLLELCPAVKFLGTVPPDKIADLYKACDIFLFLSHNEGQPNAVKEAMASGMPVLSYQVGGVSEIINDGISGSIVPSQDQVSAVEQLHMICSHSEIRTAFGQAARQIMQESFSTRTQMNILDKQLVSLIDQHRK